MAAKKLEELQIELDKLDVDIGKGRFRPQTAKGEDLSPGHLRAAIRRYLSSSGSTQTKFLSDIDVNSNSFQKFMKGKYANPWSACQNGTYEAAAKFLARRKILDKMDELNGKVAAKAAKTTKKASKKRDLDEYDDDCADDDADAIISGDEEIVKPPAKKAKKTKQAMDDELSAILAVELPEPCPVYANCDEIRRMINHYLYTSGIPKTRLINHWDVNTKSFASFMSYTGKGAGANNGAYVAAWRFFEKKRLLEKKPKSASRVEQEQRWGKKGFPLVHDTGFRWVRTDVPFNSDIYDIEKLRDRGMYDR